MAKPVVFVIGATGNVGSATIQALSTKYADKLEIRAGVRNPDKADKIKLPGVTVVQAEMGAKDKLKETLKGVDALFIVTPGVESRASLAIATAEAAKEAGVKFILVVSLTTIDLTETMVGRQLFGLEVKISSLGVPYTFIRLPFFVDNNFLFFKDTIQAQSTFYAPINADKPFTAVVIEDAGNAAATILADYTKHTNKTYTVVSARYTSNDLAKFFSEVLGREIKYIQIPYDAMKQALSEKGFLLEWQIDFLLELFSLIDNGAPETNQSDLSVYKTLTGEEPTSVKAWIEKYEAAFK